MLYRVTGIVIRGMDYGEGNKIITLFSRELGKVGIVARGAKKMKSRHSAGSQLFSYGEYSYYKGGQLGSLNHIDMIHSFQTLREDLFKTAFAAYFTEMVDRVTNDHEVNPYLFDQLLGALHALEEDKDSQALARFFEMKILQCAGYNPVLDQCAGCGMKIDQFAEAPILFSVLLGGIVCPRCKSRDTQVIAIGTGTIKLLRYFQRLDFSRLGSIQVKQQTKEELGKVMLGMMDNHIGWKLKSRNFLEQMDKYNLT